MVISFPGEIAWASLKLEQDTELQMSETNFPGRNSLGLFEAADQTQCAIEACWGAFPGEIAWASLKQGRI